MHSIAIQTVCQRLPRIALATLLLGLLIGCASPQKISPNAEEAVLPQTVQTADNTAMVKADDHNGSLWREQGDFNQLFILPKARKIGDIVTIKIVESSSAANKAGTDTERDSTLSAGIDTLFGLENQYLNGTDAEPFRKYFNPFNTNGTAAVKGGMNSEFEGKGSTSRSGKLDAFLTARVTNVYGNGNLEIVGSREIEVNHERQIMTLRGIIRTRDVSPENIIMSTYISDARITYSGTGVIDDRQKPGWLANILNAVWPF